MVLILVLFFIDGYSQSIGINSTGSAPNANAIVDVDVNNKGILLPRLNATQRGTIGSPALGLTIIKADAIQYWDGTSWVSVNNSPVVAVNPAGTNTGSGVAINSGGASANHSAILDVQGTTGGMLFPRMTTEQKNAITAVEGMLVFDITTAKFNFYNGSAWVELRTAFVSSATGSGINSNNIAINDAGAPADASAILDITSTTKGFLLPRLTNAQRDAILSPSRALLIYNTDTKSINIFNGSTYWLESNASSSGLALLTTTSVTNIAGSTASSGGNVYANGGNAILERGICWSTNTNPTTSGNKTSDGTGTGAFTSSLTGLLVSTTYYLRAYATNSNGTTYGNEVSFTTTSGLPTLAATTAASSITSTTASSGGNITDDGGSTISARGVCWSTSPNPTTANSKTTDGTDTGSFTSSITGLTAGTLYYVRAYATNSTGTSYGDQVSFTTLAAPTLAATTTASSITSTTASSGGNVTSDGGATVTARGVCWSTSPNPTTANSKTTNGTGIGSFTSSITGLTAGTLYYIRAYATNSVGTTYGTQISFTTLSLASLTTASITNKAETSATGGGNISSNGGATVTARGVCWSTSQNPTTANSKTTDGTGTGSFTSSITGLTGGTTYYVRAYATNSVGTAYGNQVQFTTEVPVAPDTEPSIITASVTNIGPGSASSGGTVLTDGGQPVTASGVCWNTTTNPTTSDNKTVDGSGTGSFTSTLTNLNPNTTYYVRAYATNSVGTEYGEQVSFTTSTVSVLQSFGGGMVVYVDGTGQHGLIAATSDVAPAVWDNTFTTTNATDPNIGAGASNTTTIVNILGAGSYAAALCNSFVSEGYDDWFLPSAMELQIMYPYRAYLGMLSASYWSSTEDALFYMAFAMNFSTGGGDSDGGSTGGQLIATIKNTTALVRPVRAF